MLNTLNNLWRQHACLSFSVSPRLGQSSSSSLLRENFFLLALSVDKTANFEIKHNARMVFFGLFRSKKLS